jgi:hypothetical protein
MSDFSISHRVHDGACMPVSGGVATQKSNAANPAGIPLMFGRCGQSLPERAHDEKPRAMTFGP